MTKSHPILENNSRQDVRVININNPGGPCFESRSSESKFRSRKTQTWLSRCRFVCGKAEIQEERQNLGCTLANQVYLIDRFFLQLWLADKWKSLWMKQVKIELSIKNKYCSLLHDVPARKDSPIHECKYPKWSWPLLIIFISMFNTFFFTQVFKMFIHLYKPAKRLRLWNAQQNHYFRLVLEMFLYLKGINKKNLQKLQKKNVCSTLLNLCHQRLRQFWRQKVSNPVPTY